MQYIWCDHGPDDEGMGRCEDRTCRTIARYSYEKRGWEAWHGDNPEAYRLFPELVEINSNMRQGFLGVIIGQVHEWTARAHNYHVGREEMTPGGQSFVEESR